MSGEIYESREYRRSRGAYCAQCAFDYFISILVSDAYLAKLLSALGLSDTLIGIISSFITAAFVFQLTAVFLAQRIRNVKRIVIIFSTVSQFLFAGLYLIPFLPVSLPIRTFFVIAGILFAYFGSYLVTSMLYKWANSFVDPKKRGEYSAGKEMLSLISGMVFTLILGWGIDRFESIGNLRGGFLFIAVSGLILALCNFISLMLIARDGASEKSEKSVPVKTVFRDILSNRNFRHIVILNVLWDVGRYLTIGFLGTFKIKELALTVGTVQIINIAGNLCRFFVSRPFGRYSDKTSYARGIELALYIAAAAFFINIFSAPKTWWCMILYTVLFYCGMAGTNQNFSNIVYSYVPAEYFVQATAIKNSISGICGFCASLVGSRLLSAVQENGNTVLGLPMYGQQLLSALSVLFMIAAILFDRFVIEKQTAMRQ